MHSPSDPPFLSVLTISSGYDPGYLTRSVATGRENYYLSAVAEHGEPPGIWTGLGCPQLGLPVGSEVDNALMERLYGKFLDPRDPEGRLTLGRAPSGFAGNDDKIAARIEQLLATEPEATRERRDQLIMQALKEQRAAVYFFDATFSVPKSVSLLHASLQLKADLATQGGREDEAVHWAGQAQVVWDAIMTANQEMLGYLQREAGYSRAGYHSRDSGRYVDAHEWVIASFAQHTSRDNDPQLHVHNAILNRVLRDDPLAARPGGRLAWRTLDGAALYAARPAAGAVAERTLAERLAVDLGVEIIPRRDGNGWEIAGVSEDTRELFSSRRRAIEPRLAELVDEYERRHGKAPNARALWSMAQFVTLDSRPGKAHSAPARETLLARWEAQSRRAETQALSAIPDATLGRREPGGAALPETGAEMDLVLVAAVADALRCKSVFTRYELLRMVNRHLPGYLGGLPGSRVTELLEELTARAVAPGGPCGAVLLTAPDMVPVPTTYRRADGLSLWRRHGAEVYTTRDQLDTEARLLCAAAQTGAPSIAPDRAARELGADRARLEARLWREHRPQGATGADPALDGAAAPLSSAALSDDQAQAAYGILTSGRAIDILVGAAGTGKTRTVAVLARAWRDAGIGRVIGLTTSTSAAHTLAAEGLADSSNLAVFLGRIKDSDRTRGHLPVRPGDLLVVDEASMVPTGDLAAVEAIATGCGAKVLLTGDPAQLSSPGPGGAMRLLADEHGYYQLVTVQRFDAEWEREASLRLRAGDADVLAEYDQRGRILEGTAEEMAAAAVRRWLADYLSGKESLLMAGTNVQAADLARRARESLAALGVVGVDDLIELADGNVAGPGDLIVARQNERIVAGEPGRRLANRDLLRIDAWEEIGEERVAVIRRRTGRDPVTGEVQWSAPFELPESYLERHVQLGYAGNVHVAQSLTVDTTHLLVDDTIGREALYVGLGRGRERNTAYTVIERARAADLSAVPRTAPELADPGASSRSRRHRFTILAAVLEREQGERTATETVRAELERAASLATLAPMWADVTRAHAARRYEESVRALVTAAEWSQYEQDAERGTLIRLLRAAELAGHDVDWVVRHAVEDRSFAGARSIAAVLHGRVRRIVGTAEPLASASYADRTPVIDDPAARRFADELAAAMDERAALLGERVAVDRPAWVLPNLGEVPAGGANRDEWVRLAGLAAAYREERGYASETDAIGPAPERASPELRASWHTAYAALRMPEQDREIAAATDGELLAWRAAYEREAGWAPPYVAGELREAHIAEDTYRADAVHAWYRADAAADEVEREQARHEAEGFSALAQEIGAHREALAEVADARRAWHAGTEESRWRALVADTELRRRYPGLELAPLHADDELAAQVDEAEPAAEDVAPPERVDVPLDLEAALEAAGRAREILAERERLASRDAEADGDDLMWRREAEAQREAEARRDAVRQEPLPSRRLEADGRREVEYELEAGE